MSHHSNKHVVFSLVAVFAILLTHWLAELIPLGHWFAHWVEHYAAKGSVAFIVAIAGAVAVLFVIFYKVSEYAVKLGEQFMGVRALRQLHVEPHRVLIFAVSLHNGQAKNTLAQLAATGAASENDKTIKITCSLGDDLARATSDKGYGLAVFQLLRGLRPHLAGKTLTRTYLLCSGDSRDEANNISTIIRRYDPNLEVVIHPMADFDDTEKLREAYEQIIADESSTRHTRPDDLVIDITGGTKTVSIAGTMATVKNSVKIQYVPNNWDKSPIHVNLVIEAPRHTGH